MDYIVKEIYKPSYNELLSIAELWSKSFGDEKKFVFEFYKKMPVHSTVCCYADEILVGITVLLSLELAYYGYAVCTDADFRGKGICRRIHEYIKEKCDREGYEYFIHPADDSLVSFYEKLGMKAVLSSYEICISPDNSLKVCEIDAGEYAFMRYLYFGGCCFHSWSQEALSFFGECGIRYLTCTIDGVDCAAAVDSGTILELCAPEELVGKCAGAFLSDGDGRVRFLTQPSHVDAPCLMSFSGRYAYFNLFFE